VGQALGERAAGGETGVVDGGKEAVQALLGVGSVAGVVDPSERLRW
jgi:hypothetical protein